MDNKKVKKCLKSYLTAKKYYDSDIEKSYDYFKQCIKILNDLKDENKLNQEYQGIIDETENECSKYLVLAIEATLDKPYIKKNIIDKSQDNALFEIIKKGQVDFLKTFEYGECNFNIFDINGQTPLHLAIKFGDTTFLKHAFKLGAGIDKTNKYGHTLLEFACLEKDPNIINYLTYCGANMKKHLDFRDGKKYFNNGNQIDIITLQKKIMDNTKLTTDIDHLDFIFDYINKEEKIELEYCDPKNSTISINKISFDTFIKKLNCMVNNFDHEKRNTFINIIKEELSND